MRTDVKIGFAVGLILFVVGAVYFIVPDSQDSEQPTKTAGTPKPEERSRVRLGGSEDAGPPTPDLATPDLATPDLATPDLATPDLATPDLATPDLATPDLAMSGADPEDETKTLSIPPIPPVPGPVVRPRYEGELTGDPAPTAGEGTPAVGDPEVVADRDLIVPRVTPRVTPRALRPDTIEITSSTGPRVEDFHSNAVRTYVVQYRDNGFWTVSARMYGDGKYFGVIADANPDVDSSSLRPGQKLVVPPLPEKDRRKAVEPTVADVFIPGGTTYTVRKDDAQGFWGVSTRIWGHGKYYEAIAKANPGVDSTRLKAGQKLAIPPKPADPSRRNIPDTGIGAIDLPSGYTTYVVRDGDRGFWDVAVKMYGNGRRFDLVAKANPGVDSNRLRPGQKLRIPPLSEAKRFAGAATAPIIEERPLEILPAETDPRPIFRLNP